MSDKTILAVDDAESNIDILVDALGSEYEVVVALDGESALEIVAEDKPDLILLDIMMPGIDGFEVLKRLKASPDTADIPVVILSAKTGAGDRDRAMQCGAIGFIQKPFQVESLFELINRVFS
jgi:putative two-component system response regulator